MQHIFKINQLLVFNYAVSLMFYIHNISNEIFTYNQIERFKTKYFYDQIILKIIDKQTHYINSYNVLARPEINSEFCCIVSVVKIIFLSWLLEYLYPTTHNNMCWLHV